MRLGGAAILLVVLSVLCAACAATPSDVRSRTDTAELTVFAAASLREAMVALEAAYRSERAALRLAVSLDASSVLRAQIEQGAPADVLLSADVDNARRLTEGGLASTPRIFARNEVVVVAPSDPGGRVKAIADLVEPGTRIVAAGRGVPITRYASELLSELAHLPDVADDLADRYESNVVTREDNVRAVLAKIELGEGDAAIVYRTDAVASDRVRTIELPPTVRVTVGYAGVVLDRSRDPAEARRFLDWVAGPSGAGVLVPLGFGPP